MVRASHISTLTLFDDSTALANNLLAVHRCAESSSRSTGSASRPGVGSLRASATSSSAASSSSPARLLSRSVNSTGRPTGPRPGPSAQPQSRGPLRQVGAHLGGYVAAEHRYANRLDMVGYLAATVAVRCRPERCSYGCQEVILGPSFPAGPAAWLSQDRDGPLIRGQALTSVPTWPGAAAAKSAWNVPSMPAGWLWRPGRCRRPGHLLGDRDQPQGALRRQGNAVLCRPSRCGPARRRDKGRARPLQYQVRVPATPADVMPQLLFLSLFSCVPRAVPGPVARGVVPALSR